MTIEKGLRIRAPSYDERDEFYSVYRSGLPGVDEISPERFNDWWERSRENGDLNHLWRVAVLKDTIIGVVINVINHELNWGFIWELAILPKYRNKGIGSKLIRKSEKLILKHHPEIEELAIGVKTKNMGALALYEKLDYKIRFLLINLRGKRWQPDNTSKLIQGPASTDQTEEMIELIPDAYWSTRTKETWKEIIKPEHKTFHTKDGQLVGYARLIPQKSKPPSTDIQYNIKSGYGPAVLEACMESVETNLIELWVQDNHQDILDVLYERGFKRIDSEFLLRKPLRK